MNDRPKIAIDRLLAIMARLRNPVGGCPWDREQTFATIAPYTIEEAYEVADAIARDDPADLKEELGDLLFQVVFHARMAEEAGRFAFADVADAISEKMERRHPHIFGDAQIHDAAQQTRAWETHKAAERAAKARQASSASGAETTGAGALAGVPLALPALLRAEKLGKRAARVGFDWPDAPSVLDKVDEEIGEIRQAVAAGEPPARVSHEIGDLLFAVAQYARHLEINPETALREAATRFERRFGHVEDTLNRQGRSPDEASLAEKEALWEEAKNLESKR
jgi:tetrapyrrole methylase family protein/MazG family protein/ATP diphosphatase